MPKSEFYQAKDEEQQQNVSQRSPCSSSSSNNNNNVNTKKTTTKKIIQVLLICLGMILIGYFSESNVLQEYFVVESWMMIKTNNNTNSTNNHQLLRSKKEGQQSPLPLQLPQITFTNIGWFHPNSTIGLQNGRMLSTKDYVDAIVKHPRYNASAWQLLDDDQQQTTTTIFTYKTPPILYAFLDIETCGEINWPALGGDIKGSSDIEGGRVPMPYFFDGHACQKINKLLQSPALSHPKSRLIVINCCPGMPHQCLGRGTKYQQSQSTSNTYYNELYDKMVVAHLTTHKTEVHPTLDMGLPPRPIKPIVLTPQEEEDLETCADLEPGGKRQYWFSFNGRPRHLFPKFSQYLEPLHGTLAPDGSGKKIHAQFTAQHYLNSTVTQYHSDGLPAVTASNDPQQQHIDVHYTLLRQTIFAGCPRGDNLYSYRLAEILSAGAIPVIYADGYVLPFTKAIVDWNSAAVLIPQSDIDFTMDILSNITSEQICQLKRNAYKIYQNYIQNSTSVLQGILESIDSRLFFEQQNNNNITFAPGNAIIAS